MVARSTLRTLPGSAVMLWFWVVWLAWHGAASSDAGVPPPPMPATSARNGRATAGALACPLPSTQQLASVGRSSRYDGWCICPTGSFCDDDHTSGTGIGGCDNSTISSVPWKMPGRDRWDPLVVSAHRSGCVWSPELIRGVCVRVRACVRE